MRPRGEKIKKSLTKGPTVRYGLKERIKANPSLVGKEQERMEEEVNLLKDGKIIEVKAKESDANNRNNTMGEKGDTH